MTDWNTDARLWDMARIESEACTEDYCFVCRRCTDHFGEHTDAQLIAYIRNHPWKSPGDYLSDVGHETRGSEETQALCESVLEDSTQYYREDDYVFPNEY